MYIYIYIRTYMFMLQGGEHIRGHHIESYSIVIGWTIDQLIDPFYAVCITLVYFYHLVTTACTVVYTGGPVVSTNVMLPKGTPANVGLTQVIN